MKIYLFRHAQKAMDLSGDPDLTVEGHAQATKVLDRVLKNELPRPTELWVSPKKRTHSTFRPLSEHLSIPLQVNIDLTEQQSDENISDFRSRIEKLMTGTAMRSQGVVYLCSHYDFLVEAMGVLPSDKDLTDTEFSHWSPCQYIGFEVTEEGLFQFIECKRVQL